MNKILILSQHHPILIESIEKAGYTPIIYLNEKLEDISPQEAAEIVGIVTSNAYYITKAEIELFPHLKFIGRLGSGMEIIDTTCCDEKSITYWSSPIGNANAVAEHALGMLITINSFMRKSHLEILNNQFLRKENTRYELHHLNVGLIGLGSNGTLFAEKLLALGCQVTAFDINPERKQAITHENFTFHDNIEPLFDCQAISLHIPLNSETTHTIDDQFIESMKQDFILINCARGPLLDTHALYKHLKSGKILGAGIDVWEYEPISSFPTEYREELDYILNHPSVVATAHIAGYSHDATYKMSQIIGECIMNCR